MPWTSSTGGPVAGPAVWMNIFPPPASTNRPSAGASSTAERDSRTAARPRAIESKTRSKMAIAARMRRIPRTRRTSSASMRAGSDSEVVELLVFQIEVVHHLPHAGERLLDVALRARGQVVAGGQRLQVR